MTDPADAGVAESAADAADARAADALAVDPDLPDGVDAGALARTLEGNLDVDVASVDLLADGLNLLLTVSTAAAPGTPRFVVRSPRKLRDAGYMIDLETEYAVLTELDATPVPTPEPVLYCEDGDALGDAFYAMTHVDGAVVPLGSDLPERFRTPGARERFAHALVDGLADVHAVDPDRFAGVLDHERALEQVERASDRLAAATRETGLDAPALERVGDWLRERAPAPGDADRTLVHGDYRPGNVQFTGDDAPAVAGVLDWESAMLGDPLTELGYLLLRWRDPGDPTPDLDALEARYEGYDDALAHLRRVNDRGFAPYTADEGSPSRRDLVARYEAATGRRFDQPRFYVAHAAYLLATVWADLHRHAVDAGRDSEWPPHVAHLARVAELVVDGAFDLEP